MIMLAAITVTFSPIWVPVLLTVGILIWAFLAFSPGSGSSFASAMSSAVEAVFVFLFMVIGILAVWVLYFIVDKLWLS